VPNFLKENKVGRHDHRRRIIRVEEPERSLLIRLAMLKAPNLKRTKLQRNSKRQPARPF